MHLTFEMFITYALLASSILSLWVAGDRKPFLNLPVWVLLFTPAFLTGLMGGFVTPLALIPIVIFGVASVTTIVVCLSVDRKFIITMTGQCISQLR